MAVRAATLAKAFAAVLFAVPVTGLANETVPLRAGLPDGFPVARDSRLAGDLQQTRFVMDLSRRVDVRVFTLADPYRVVVDLPQVSFQLPVRAGENGRGLVKAFRYGLVMQGGSRMVFDVERPVRVEKAFVLEATDSQPARLVLDLAPTDRATFMRVLALDQKPPVQPQAKGVERLPEIRGDPRPVIVLDPGHGGIDNGSKAASGEAEKTIVLDFALMLRDQIERTGRYRVVMTRTDDTFVPLAQRMQMARQRQASLFISIHADALRQGEAQGATVYTVSDTATDAEAARLAETENRADVIAGIDLSYEPGDVADILIDLAQRETRTFSTHFARGLVTELRNVAKLHKHPLKSAGFKVLKAPDVPSVLLELGYVSNREDLKQLTSESWRNRTSRSVLLAIEGFFSTRMAGPSGPSLGASVGGR